MNYTDPNMTQRQMVEASQTVVDDIIAGIDARIAAAKAALEQPIDYITAQAINGHVSVLSGNRMTLIAEQTRLTGILDGWDAPVG